MKMTAVASTLSLLAALLLVLSLALACGDDDGGDPNGDSDSLPGYFADLQRVFEDAEAATNDAEARADDIDSGTALDVRLSAFDVYLGETDTIFNTTIGLLESLSVPDAAAGAHQDFIDGVSESVALANALRNDLTGITTDEQMEGRLTEFNSEIAAAEDKADAACLALQRLADTEDLAIDLACEA